MHAGTVDEWAKWLEACRTGLRRPLGLDMDRRRYWAFGGTAAAWRVWVEEEQGGPWGYYEGVHCWSGGGEEQVPWLGGLCRGTGVVAGCLQPWSTPSKSH